jgi:hypothetical protein
MLVTMNSVCNSTKSKRRYSRPMMCKGRAVPGRAMYTKGAEECWRISQVDSLGTVSFILWGLYTFGSAHRPWSVCYILLIIV